MTYIGKYCRSKIFSQMIPIQEDQGRTISKGNEDISPPDASSIENISTNNAVQSIYDTRALESGSC